MTPVPRTKRSRGPGVIGVAGLGYVGLATAVAFAERGHRVRGYDVDLDRIADLRKGRVPIHEKGLAALIARHVKSGRLGLVDSTLGLLDSCEAVFLAVPTPSGKEGAIDLSFIRQAATEVGYALSQVPEWRLLVVKSTVVPGTALEVVAPEIARASQKEPGRGFAVASNPEFLAEGTMVEDSLHPARVVIGVTDPRSEDLLRRIYAPFRTNVVVLTPSGAELVKYASNAMLASRVSFANEVARLAESAGVDSRPVLEAVGLDPRIGGKFLHSGPGFGGSCFTKDVRAIIAWAKAHQVETPMTEATLAVNALQAVHVVDLAARGAGTLQRKRVALLGLAFKPGTSDTRDSRAFPMVDELLARGAVVTLFDPVAMEGFRWGLSRPASRALGERLFFSTTLREALSHTDLAVIQCDWDLFRKAPAGEWKRLKDRLVVDARRTVDPRRLARVGVRYLSVGLGTP